MADFITTYTGIHFYPTDPDPEAINIEDIAHALSLLCRGNGHVSTFWSVAQHCIICAREAAAREWPDRLVLACLLHDASECYLSDVPRPFKAELVGYREHEDRLLDMIYTRYLGTPLSPEEQRMAREIDDGALYYDLRDLLHNEQSEQDPQFHVIPSYDFRSFQEVEKEYLELFRYYYNRYKNALGGDSHAKIPGGGTLQDLAELPTRPPQRPGPDYDLLADQVQAFAETESSLMPLLSNAAALLKDAMADVNWAGFYLRREPEGTFAVNTVKEAAAETTVITKDDGTSSSPDLLLGPFQGKAACIRIPWGKGVCGTAADQDRTQLVPDVHAFPGHIACDSASNSEIVVPIHRGDGSVAAVLDIDSPLKGRFDLEDQAGLERFVRVLEQYGEWD